MDYPKYNLVKPSCYDGITQPNHALSLLCLWTDLRFQRNGQIEGGSSDNGTQTFFFLTKEAFEGLSIPGSQRLLGLTSIRRAAIFIVHQDRLKLSQSVQIGASKEGLIDMGGVLESNSMEK